MTAVSRLLFMLALWSVTLAAPQAGYAFTLDEAEQAVKSGRAADVIPALDAYQPKTQTEALRRLWILGVANARAGRPQAAIDPLAKLVAKVPSSPLFRLELANALIAAGQSERARYHLEQAKGAGLPKPVHDRVQAQINQLQRPKNWQGYFRFALVPESNAARRTQAETVPIGGLVFGLKPGARAQPANGVELGFGLAALPILNDRTRARFGVDVQARLFDGRAPNDVFVRTSAGVLRYDTAGRQLSAEVFASQRWLSDAPYARSAGVALSYNLALGRRTRLAFGAQNERISYDVGAYDVRRTAANVRVFYAATPQLLLRAGAWVENRTSSYTLAAGVAKGVSIGGDYTFVGGLRVGLDLSYDHDAFDGIHPLFGVGRTDRKTSATVQFTNQNWNYRGFAPVLRIGVERQDSSIVLNSYRNVATSIGFTRSF
ncbi:surface lipoprotein assembly modifier [Rhodalgimonas zhirmunskyi]|uniref:Surface lipoprotein assembly modifier n=1 Tax=Rhodalgimonas zhirmunskyi TaxID=2964767 RepID=A0AAJ1U637_9RHOB|nr:surface lipoprotein assembly modifier [Rhodoalgimonas zhirmunskyi]MDQ2093815.1 surface lipoprotein assembly modifier [Rhodoalgimonas zhirmunskyi]